MQKEHTYIVARLEECCMYDDNSYNTQFVTLNMAVDISYSGMMLMIVATMFMMMIMIVMLLLRRSTRTRVRLRVSTRMRMMMMMMMAIMKMLMQGILIMMMMTVAQWRGYTSRRHNDSSHGHDHDVQYGTYYCDKATCACITVDWL